MKKSRTRARTIFYIIALIFIVLILGILTLVFTLGARSGVTAEQVNETLPGDSVISQPWISIDRAATMPASATDTWPWVEQLGNSRAGWYAPLWIENALNKYAASTTLPQYQNLKVGDIVPDWGGGSLRVLAIQPDTYVLYCSVRGAAASTEATVTPATCDFTWALVLENDTASSTSFHLRLRLPKPQTGLARYIPPALPGFIDYATDVVMFAGLQERLRTAP
jgi:hypothetical protein